MKTTIIVSPRERFSSIIASLTSLFGTIPEDVPVIVVEGHTPATLREQILALQTTRPFTWISLEHFVTPQEARNIEFDHVRTPYVVFSDNDIHYEAKWLEHLEANADQNHSDLVAPLICIGPPSATTVHHAGGRLVVERRSGKPHVTEEHRLMGQSISAVNETTAPVANEIVEFHCFLAKAEYIRRIGPLDERLTTREQIDLGLRTKIAGGKVTFEKSAIVTYMAKVPFNETDLRYLCFRWSDSLALGSLEAFKNTWGIATDDNRVINRWIRPHRFRAFASVFPRELQALGEAAFKRIHVDLCEKQFETEASPTRQGHERPRCPGEPNQRERQAFFARRADVSGITTSYSSGNIHSQKRPLIVAGMATMPSRASTFEAAMESILPQVHRLYLFFDRFDSPPPILHPKVVTLDSQTFGDLRANGKFLGLLFNRGDLYYASVDDDILYPQDYIETMFHHSKAFGDNVVLGVHGSILKDQIDSYKNDRQVIYRTKNLIAPAQVDVVGTCTSFFRSDKFMFDVRKWQDVNMVDLMFAIECAFNDLQLWLVPRETDWVKALATSKEQPDSIYNALKVDDSKQTVLARKLKLMQGFRRSYVENTGTDNS